VFCEKNNLSYFEGKKHIKIVATGDDILNRHDGQKIDWQAEMADLGLDSDSKYRDRLCDLEFCSSVPVPCQEGVVMAPLAGAVLAKLGWTIDRDKLIPDDIYLLSKVKSQYDANHVNPIIQPLFDRILQLKSEQKWPQKLWDRMRLKMKTHSSEDNFRMRAIKCTWNLETVEWVEHRYGWDEAMLANWRQHLAITTDAKRLLDFQPIEVVIDRDSGGPRYFCNGERPPSATNDIMGSDEAKAEAHNATMHAGNGNILSMISGTVVPETRPSYSVTYNGDDYFMRTNLEYSDVRLLRELMILNPGQQPGYYIEALRIRDQYRQTPFEYLWSVSMKALNKLAHALNGNVKSHKPNHPKSNKGKHTNKKKSHKQPKPRAKEHHPSRTNSAPISMDGSGKINKQMSAKARNHLQMANNDFWSNIGAGTYASGQVISSTTLALPNLGPRTKAQSLLWEKWLCKKMVFRYVSAAPTTQAGQLIMFIDRDVAYPWGTVGPSANNLQRARVQTGACEFSVWNRGTCSYTPEKAQQSLYVASEMSDPRLYSVGTFVLMAVTGFTSASDLGSITFDSEILFSGATYNQSAISDTMAYNTTATIVSSGTSQTGTMLTSPNLVGTTSTLGGFQSYSAGACHGVVSPEENIQAATLRKVSDNTVTTVSVGGNTNIYPSAYPAGEWIYTFSCADPSTVIASANAYGIQGPNTIIHAQDYSDHLDVAAVRAADYTCYFEVLEEADDSAHIPIVSEFETGVARTPDGTGAPTTSDWGIFDMMLTSVAGGPLIQLLSTVVENVIPFALGVLAIRSHGKESKVALALFHKANGRQLVYNGKRMHDHRPFLSYLSRGGKEIISPEQLLIKRLSQRLAMLESKQAATDWTDKFASLSEDDDEKYEKIQSPPVTVSIPREKDSNFGVGISPSTIRPYVQSSLDTQKSFCYSSAVGYLLFVGAKDAYVKARWPDYSMTIPIPSVSQLHSLVDTHNLLVDYSAESMLVYLTRKVP